MTTAPGGFNTSLILFFREELKAQTLVSERFENRARDLKAMLDSSKSKIEVCTVYRKKPIRKNAHQVNPIWKKDHQESNFPTHQFS